MIFLICKYVLLKKVLSEKDSTIKRFEYSAFGKNLKGQSHIPKNQYKFFKDKMNVNNNSKEEDESDEVKCDESKLVKNLMQY